MVFNKIFMFFAVATIAFANAETDEVLDGSWKYDRCVFNNMEVPKEDLKNWKLNMVNQNDLISYTKQMGTGEITGNFKLNKPHKASCQQQRPASNPNDVKYMEIFAQNCNRLADAYFSSNTQFVFIYGNDGYCVVDKE